MQELFNTPILFLIYNRPDQTKKVFELIKNIKPSKLYIAADGPKVNKANEQLLCKETRAVVDLIDWNCETKVLFSDKNLGCGVAVSTGISWFFDNEEQGIILEDDCLPSISFFYFCEKMLHFYKNDDRIWHITGYNTQKGIKRGDGDYYYSQETPIWGWASWRRVWKHYNLKLNGLQELEKSRIKYYLKKSYLQSLTVMFDFWKVDKNRVDTWDYQYTYYQLINSGLSVIPNFNLIENIGFGVAATNTKKINNDVAKNIATDFDVFNLVHPTYVIADSRADTFTYNGRTSLLKKIYVIGEDILKNIFNRLR